MNTGLRNEISFLSGLAAMGLFLKGKPRLAAGIGLAAFGLRTFPVPTTSFRNKSVIISGGSRGLGLALAENFVQEGALVTLLARDSAELRRAAQQLEGFRGVPVLAIACDVTDRTQLRSAFQEVLQHFGAIDILINNAGSIAAGPFESMTMEDFDAQMKVHYHSPLMAIQEIVPLFKRRHGGCVVNISSIGGKVAVPHMAAYCGSKFALAGLSQALATELEAENIQITTVYPGLMRTGSPIQGVFKGDHEKEFAWFALFDSTPGFSMSADRAARQILRSIREGRREVVLSLPANLAVFANANFPELFQSIMSLMNRGLPSGQSRNHQTGAASQSWIQQKAWAQPFLGILKRAQKRYNEKEKFDASFNLNLNEFH